MRIGINSHAISKFYNEFESLKVIKEAGYDCVDYGYYIYSVENGVYDNDDYKKHAYELRQYLDILGLEIYQMHAPLTGKIGIDVNEDFLFEMTIRGFEVAQILGCKYVVVHPRKYQFAETYFDIEKQREYNLSYFKKLGIYANKFGVKIAIENLYRYHNETHTPIETMFKSPYEMKEFLNILGGDFVACIDTGHAFINGYQPSVYLGVLKEKVKVIHINDNYGVDDHHLIPYAGKIDWDDFGKILSKIGFDGVISMELVDGLNFPVETGFKELKKEEIKFYSKIMKQFCKKYNL